METLWEHAFESYAPLLHQTIVRMCPARLGLQAADIEQEALIRLLRALRSGRAIAHPASYLYRIAASVTIDAVRRVKARREQSLDAFDEDDSDAEAVVDQGVGPEAWARGRQVRERVRRLMAGLSENRRRAVGLHLQGFTPQEIGQLLGWSEPKARNLVYRGLAELRAGLQAAGIGPRPSLRAVS